MADAPSPQDDVILKVKLDLSEADRQLKQMFQGRRYTTEGGRGRPRGGNVEDIGITGRGAPLPSSRRESVSLHAEMKKCCGHLRSIDQNISRSFTTMSRMAVAGPARVTARGAGVEGLAVAGLATRGLRGAARVGGVAFLGALAAKQAGETFLQFNERMAQSLAPFSPEIMEAMVQRDLARMMQRMELGRRLGPDISKMLRSRASLLLNPATIKAFEKVYGTTAAAEATATGALDMATQPWTWKAMGAAALFGLRRMFVAPLGFSGFAPSQSPPPSAPPPTSVDSDTPGTSPTPTPASQDANAPAPSPSPSPTPYPRNEPGYTIPAPSEADKGAGLESMQDIEAFKAEQRQTALEKRRFVEQHMLPPEVQHELRTFFGRLQNKYPDGPWDEAFDDVMSEPFATRSIKRIEAARKRIAGRRGTQNTPLHELEGWPGD